MEGVGSFSPFESLSGDGWQAVWKSNVCCASLHATPTRGEGAGLDPAVVLFLASEAASFITGSNYRVDSGSVASI